MLRFLLLAAAFGLPALSYAQSASRYYLGAGVAVFTDNLFHSGSYHSLTPVGPALTGGLVLGPRAAVQVSPSLLWGSSTTEYAGYQAIGGNNTVTTSRYQYQVRIFSLPVLLRYTFTNPTSRLRFDGLGGFTLLHSGSTTHYSSVTNGRVDSQHDYDGSTNQAYLALGPGLRYNLSPQFELVASAPVNCVLGGSYGNFNDRLVLNVLGGVHYLLGAR